MQIRKSLRVCVRVAPRLDKFAEELSLLFRDQLPWAGYEEDHSFFRANRERCSPICTFPREDIPFLLGAISAFYEGDVFSLYGSNGNRPCNQGVMNAFNALVPPRFDVVALRPWGL